MSSADADASTRGSALRRGLAWIFDGWAEAWRALEGPELEPRPWHSHYLSHRVCAGVLRDLGRRLDGEVIDIGAGTGHGARYLDPATTRYFPTDIPGGRDPGDARITRHGSAAVFPCSVYDLPFADGHFGGAMMLSVLEHLADPRAGLIELARTLRPGAFVLLSVPFLFPVHGAPADFRRWTAHGLDVEMKAVGLDVVEVRACGALASMLALNFNLGLRHAFARHRRAGRIAMTALLPLLLVVQLVVNALALVFDRADRTGRHAPFFALLARKPLADDAATR